ncbi:MAG: 2-C-methyl-D-erythritol 2,4-cyclodiphosphate synthase [Acidimicrobiia bacterium]|nr:MAG: 2-C-methyl-D-erythritol 2,4-cyclodiphosphate synthase [Acidimicrobiia bacterium]
MADVRTGIGYDAHRFGGDGPVVLAGISIEHSVGVLGTSDGDVAAHAVCDALLGAVAAGDLGTYFPSSDPQWEGADSLDLLRSCTALVTESGYSIGSVDVTIIAQSLRVTPHRELMRSRLAETMDIPMDRVSVKATSTDGLGWIGTDAGLAAQAIATVHS